MGYEISKKLRYESIQTATPLGVADCHKLSDQMVLGEGDAMQGLGGLPFLKIPVHPTDHLFEHVFLLIAIVDGKILGVAEMISMTA